MFQASLCPKHVETEVHNKHLIVASCWFFLSSHFAHDARSQEPKECRARQATDDNMPHVHSIMDR